MKDKGGYKICNTDFLLKPQSSCSLDLASIHHGRRRQILPTDRVTVVWTLGTLADSSRPDLCSMTPQRAARSTNPCLISSVSRGIQEQKKAWAVSGREEKRQSSFRVTDKGAANFPALLGRHVDFVYYVCGRNTRDDPSCHQYPIVSEMCCLTTRANCVF